MALEKVILEIKDLVYNLSLKMLLFPEDAKDASQEILVKVITHLSTFKGDSQFTTWVYRVASNYLLTAKGRLKRFTMSFEEYEGLIDSGHNSYSQYARNAGELSLLEEEVKVSCTHGLLMCLNETGRLVYILGEILEFTSQEGGAILNISADNFRQQLKRSREKIRGFLQNKCGLVNPENPCRCHKKIDHLIDKGLIESTQLRFASKGRRSIDLMEKMKALEKTAAIYRSTPGYMTPVDVIEKMKETIQSLRP